MDQNSFLLNFVIFLAAAVIAVPIFKRLGLGSVLGYLFAGVLIGPFALKLIHSPEEILHFSEFGVVLLLFLIGLEIKPTQFQKLRMPIFGTGSLQVMGTTAVLTAVGVLLLKQSLIVSLIAAMGFSLSSTAIVLQILRERNLMNLTSGHYSFAVLLFQDLAVIPMVAVLAILAPANSASAVPLWLVIGKAVAAIAVVILGGRLILRPVFRYIAQTHLREVFTAFSLLLVTGIAMLMQAAGLSMALGTFLAGVLLAESEYRHELEIDIEPFKGLLLGLFFISVGMSADLSLFFKTPLLILGFTLALVTLKVFLLSVIGMIFKIPVRDNWIFALALSQVGEFAFVLYNSAAGLGIFPRHIADFLTLVVAISMASTPLILKLYEWLIEPRLKNIQKREADTIIDNTNPVIVAGVGRFGGVVARMLAAKGIGITVIDHDASQIDMISRFGFKVYYGDATRLDLLHAAGAHQAKVLVLAIDDMQAAEHSIEMIQKNFPNLKIIARARSRQDAYKFLKMGLPQVFRETFGTALTAGEAVLRELGLGAFEAKKIVKQFQEHDEKQLAQALHHVDDEKALIAMAKKGREELSRLMTDDRTRLKDEKDWK